MKRGSIVKAFPGEGLEVFDGLRSDIRPELDDHVTLASLEDGHLVFRVGSAIFFGFVSSSHHEPHRETKHTCKYFHIAAQSSTFRDRCHEQSRRKSINQNRRPVLAC